jgi:hypothetical protein
MPVAILGTLEYGFFTVVSRPTNQKYADLKWQEHHIDNVLLHPLQL